MSFILLVTVVILLVVAPQGVDGACSHTVGVEHLGSSLDPHLMHQSHAFAVTRVFSAISDSYSVAHVNAGVLCSLLH